MTIFYQTSGIVKQTVRRHRNADLIVVSVSALIVFALVFCLFFALAQISSSDTRMTLFGFIWIPLAVNTFYCCPATLPWHPFPLGAPGETEEEMPTRGDRSTPHHSNWRSHLKACNFFSQFLEQVDQVSTINNYESRLNTKEMPTREDRTTKHHF